MNLDAVLPAEIQPGTWLPLQAGPPILDLFIKAFVVVLGVILFVRILRWGLYSNSSDTAGEFDIEGLPSDATSSGSQQTGGGGGTVGGGDGHTAGQATTVQQGGPTSSSSTGASPTTPQQQCTSCGSAVSANSAFCNSCGSVWDPNTVVLEFSQQAVTLSTGNTIGNALRRELGGTEVTASEANNISRQHLEFKREQGVTYVRDLDSMNGTSLDGTQLSPGTWTQVSDGATIELGNTVTGTVRVPK